MKTSTSVPLRYILFSLLAVTVLACASKKPKLLMFEYLPAVFEHEYIESEAKVYLVNDPKRYQELLDELKMKQQDRETYTEYWEKNSLLLIYGGTRPSSGYNIQTDSILVTGKSLAVIATLTKPGDNCMVADVITYPVQLLSIPKSAAQGDIKFKLKTISKACR